jgi:ATP-dependent exoDNAse (exonuclease V) beta subunit
MPFNHVKLESLNFDLNSVTTESGRRYTTPDGQSYPSITTVLSHNQDKTFLNEWRNRIGHEEANKITQKSAGRGTKLHTICEKYLLNEMGPLQMSMMMPDVKDFFLQLKPHIDTNIGNVYGLEQPLYSHRLKIAGRCDCIAEWDGKLSIVDWKNSRKEKKEDWIQNYFIQCTGYAEMFEDVTGMPIEQIVVGIASEEGTPQIFVREKKSYVGELNRYISNFYLTN